MPKWRHTQVTNANWQERPDFFFGSHNLRRIHYWEMRKAFLGSPWLMTGSAGANLDPFSCSGHFRKSFRYTQHRKKRFQYFWWKLCHFLPDFQIYRFNGFFNCVNKIFIVYDRLDNRSNWFSLSRDTYKGWRNCIWIGRRNMESSS